MRKVVGVDLGATSVKIFLGEFNGRELIVKKVQKIKNYGSTLTKYSGSYLVWDIVRIYDEVRKRLDELEDLESVSFSSWGVDFCLFDEEGRVLALPYHYRDSRTEGAMERFFEKMKPREIYEITGAQLMSINTLYQLHSMVINNDPFLKIAQKFLMIADTFNYWFSGEPVVEYTLATTTQMIDIRARKWSKEILKNLGLEHIVPEIVQPGTILGRSRFGNYKVISSVSHDTSAALVATPLENNDAFISSGTWSIIGIELENPLISDETFKLNFANEGAYDGVKFIKNVTGMWILEECNKKWNLDYERLLEIPHDVEVDSWIDPSDSYFFTPGDMVEKLKSYYRKTGQRVLETPAEQTRSILESMAFNYALTIEQLETLKGKEVKKIHIVGGGARNFVLNQLTSNVTGKIVIAGPYEATAVGNALVQLIALGDLSSLSQAREIIKNSFKLEKFFPENCEYWREKYEIWKERFDLKM